MPGFILLTFSPTQKWLQEHRVNPQDERISFADTNWTEDYRLEPINNSKN